MPMSEAKKRANAKWNTANYVKVPIYFYKSEKTELQNFCKSKDISVNSYIRRAVRNQLLTDGVSISEIDKYVKTNND